MAVEHYEYKNSANAPSILTYGPVREKFYLWFNVLLSAIPHWFKNMPKSAEMNLKVLISLDFLNFLLKAWRLLSPETSELLYSQFPTNFSYTLPFSTTSRHFIRHLLQASTSSVLTYPWFTAENPYKPLYLRPVSDCSLSTTTRTGVIDNHSSTSTSFGVIDNYVYPWRLDPNRVQPKTDYL